MMKILRYTLYLSLLSLTQLTAQVRVDQNGEPYAEDILNNVWKWLASPVAPNTQNDPTGFASNRITPLPKPGIHPRLLFSPEDIPSIRERITNTNTGKLLLLNLRSRTVFFDNPKNWEYRTFNDLLEGRWEAARKTLDSSLKPNGSPGHYQPYFVYELMLKSFESLIFDNKEEGKKLATVFYNYTRSVKPLLEQSLKTKPYPEDAWRNGSKEGMSYQFVAYLYDFNYNFMSPEQRDYVRSLLALYTNGRITLGMKIPPHFRNWNWIMVAQSFVLNVMAIDGEKGYDPRVYKKSVEVVRSYLDYAISPQGMSTEAVGYTSFGFYWGCPAMVAMTRHGDNMLTHPHFKAMKNWWAHTMLPFATRWNSHGDGGDAGPSVEQVAMMKYFYPTDGLVDYLWQHKLQEKGDKTLLDKMNIELPLIFATDPNTDANGKPVDYQNGKALNLPMTFYDSTRGSIDTRSAWDKDAAMFLMECRHDGIGASHEHADRGNFDFVALGRAWSLDGFRGVESKYHNIISIDGRGQGYFAPPAEWLATIDKPEATFGICNNKYAYDWRWPKPIETSSLDDPKFKTDRYKSYLPAVQRFHSLYKNQTFENDPTPHVVAHYKPFLYGKPLEWDEDGWPVRVPYNPVEYSFRTAGLVRGAHPYSLIVDDIKKDAQAHLYDWVMMLEWDLEIISIEDKDIILGKAKTSNLEVDDRFKGGSRKTEKGEPLLLVRIIDIDHPDSLHFDQTPPARLEVFEKVNTQFFRDRTFGLDKRLVIPCLSNNPHFKILLYPYRAGETLPKTTFKDNDNGEKTLEIEPSDNSPKDKFLFRPTQQGRTLVNMERGSEKVF